MEVMVVGPQVFVGPDVRISTVYSDIYNKNILQNYKI